MTPTTKSEMKSHLNTPLMTTGLIRDLGKFQWKCYNVRSIGCRHEWLASEDTGRVWFFEICTDERAHFPELVCVRGFHLSGYNGLSTKPSMKPKKPMSA